jgi:hypothetical protein
MLGCEDRAATGEPTRRAKPPLRRCRACSGSFDVMVVPTRSRERSFGEPLFEVVEARVRGGGQFLRGPSPDEDRARSLAEQEHQTGDDAHRHRRRSTDPCSECEQRVSLLEQLSATEGRVGRRRLSASEASIRASLSGELRPGNEVLQSDRQLAALLERIQLDGAHEELATAPWIHPLSQRSIDLRFVSPCAKPCPCAAQRPARKRADLCCGEDRTGHVSMLPGASPNPNGASAASRFIRRPSVGRQCLPKAPSPPSLRGGRAGQDQVVILDDDQPGSLGLVSRSRTL